MNTFDDAITAVLKREGGYVDDPADLGGETYCGISRRAHPDWSGWATVDRVKAEVARIALAAALSREPGLLAAVMDLYRLHYWNPLYERLPQSLATKILDVTVNLGKERGIRLLQQALNDAAVGPVAIDGVFGPQTLQACRLADPARLLQEIRTRQVLQYTAIVLDQPDQRTFLRGWIRRAVAALALTVLLATPVSADIADRIGPSQIKAPACRGDEHGYWQVHISQRPNGRHVVMLALTILDFLDASTIICWADAEQQMQALPPAKEVRDSRLEFPSPYDGRQTRP